MKKLLYLPMICYVAFACSKDEIKTYDAENFIYFSKRVTNTITYWDTLTVYNFFFDPAEVTSSVVRFNVTAGGTTSGKDRIFLIDVESDGGVEGTDFEVSREQIIPAGKSEANIDIKLSRQPHLHGNTFSLKVTLLPNAEFSLKMPVIYDKTDTIQRLSRRLEYKDELGEPEFWTARKTYIGYFSIPKFNAMNDYWNTTIDDWLDADSQYRKNFNNYMIVFGNYLNRMAALGPDQAIRDPDKNSTRGYMTITGGVMGIPTTVIPADWPATPEWEGN